MCQSSTDWWLPEGEGEMCEGGQIDGADWKWDFVGYTDYSVYCYWVIMLHTWNLSNVVNQFYPNKKEKRNVSRLIVLVFSTFNQRIV